MKFPDLSPAAFLAWLRRGQGRGGQPPDGLRGTELATYAEAASASALLLVDAIEQRFPRTLDTLLGEAEVAFGLPQNTVRTDTERRRRIRAALLTLASLTADRWTEVTAAVNPATGVNPPVLERTTRADVAGADASPEAIFRPSFVSGDFPIDELAPGQPYREALVDLLLSWLPASMVARTGREWVARLLTNDVVAEWNGTGRLVGQCNVSKTTIPATPGNRPPARAWDFMPGQRLDADALNRAQAATLWEGFVDGTSGGAAGGRSVFIVWDLGVGSTVSIDAGIDWRPRYLYATGRHFATNDYRPGQANDNLGNQDTRIEGFGYALSTAVIPVLPASALTITVDGSGHLTLNNMTGAVSRGWMIVTGASVVKAGIGGTTLKDFVYGDDLAAVPVDEGFWTQWWGAVATLRATASQAWADYAGDGGIHRVGLALVRAGEAYVLDASTDWRDRLVSIRRVADGAAMGAFPGADDDALTATATSTPVPFFSGAGAGDRTDPWAVEDPLGGIWYYARDSDGALMVEAESPGQATLLFIVDATEQSGQRSADPPPLVYSTSPIDGNEIMAIELNVPQDVACLDQVTGKRRTYMGDDLGQFPTRSETFPLGRLTHGSPAIPIEWLVRDRFGEDADVEELVRFQRRQNLTGGRIRFPFWASIGTGTTYVLDPVRDYRDRFAWATGVYATTDIRPTRPNEADVNTTATRWQGARYFGAGGSTYRLNGTSSGTEIRIEANATTGQLTISHNSGSTIYVVGWIEATDVLGPRAVRRLPH